MALIGVDQFCIAKLDNIGQFFDIKYQAETYFKQTLVRFNDIEVIKDFHFVSKT